MHERQTELKYKWENERNEFLSISDLDENLILNIIEGGIRRGRISQAAKNDNVQSALRRLKLTHEGKICNSAAILFGKNLIDYPQAKIRLARFRGTDKRGLFSIKVNNQYRIEFTLNTESEEPSVVICNIVELSNHYK